MKNCEERKTVRDTCTSSSLFERVHFARPLRQINIHDSGGNYVRQLPTLRRWNIDGARPELGQIEMNDTSTYVCRPSFRALSSRSANARRPWSTDLHNESWIRLPYLTGWPIVISDYPNRFLVVAASRSHQAKGWLNDRCWTKISFPLVLSYPHLDPIFPRFKLMRGLHSKCTME